MHTYRRTPIFVNCQKSGCAAAFIFFCIFWEKKYNAGNLIKIQVNITKSPQNSKVIAGSLCAHALRVAVNIGTTQPYSGTGA